MGKIIDRLFHTEYSDDESSATTTIIHIVRCKDCLWRGDDEYCDKHGFQNATDEFFCASGRKEQDDG